MTLVVWLGFGCAASISEPVAPPALVSWDVVPSNPYVEAEVASEELVSIVVTADMPDELIERKLLNVSLVIDHSGSMTGEQLDDAKRAVEAVLKTLRDDDRVSIIAFSSEVEVLLPQTAWSEVDTVALRASLAALQPRGTTDMYNALTAAYSELVKVWEPQQRVSRIVLLSDGEANDPTYLPQIAQTAFSSGIAITAMGLGPFHNEVMMAQMADLSGGHYRFIEASDNIGDFFMAEVQSMEQIITHNATLTFTLGPNVVATQIYGGQAGMSGNQLSIYLGDMSSGEKREVALRLSVNAKAQGAHMEIADAVLTWNDAAFETNLPYRLTEYVGAESTKDLALIESNIDTKVVQAVERLHASWEIEHALNQVEAGNIDYGQQLLQQGADRYRQNSIGLSDEDAGLPDLAESISTSLDSYAPPTAPVLYDGELNLGGLEGVDIGGGYGAGSLGTKASPAPATATAPKLSDADLIQFKKARAKTRALSGR
ncbi:MAG: hypothetical protein AUK47_20085 [Deltaproteobacteria bacterium CG2_30_63_29]|nr:MAG: hypothetical protein AUK47_20085 [Deltaproteobacteria bacterium CG2_30_63_29]